MEKISEPISVLNYKDTLTTFKNLIKNLKKENNIVIGGTTALMLHGLIVRNPSDLDIIIYNPSDGQKKIIESLLDYDCVSNYVTDIEHRRAFKFKKNGSILDIIIEKDKHPDFNNLLFCQIESEFYRVQSIEMVIKAKSKYKIHDNKNFEKKFSYVREKDLVDFLRLKNENFNPS